MALQPLQVLQSSKNPVFMRLLEKFKVLPCGVTSCYRCYTFCMICTRHKHNIPFNVVQMDFASRDDVVIWIIKNQFGRRNLPAYERAKLALRLKPVIAEKAKEQQLSTLKQGNTVPQISAKRGTPIETREELAKVAGVSHDTIAKVEKIEQKATPEIKTQLQTGEISINQAYKTVKKEENRQKRQESRCNAF